MFCKIQKHLLPIKGHYVLFFGGMSPVYPFIPIIIRNMGFSNNIVGIVFLWLPICGMVAKTWIGALADKLKKQRFLFLLFIFLAFAFEAFILLLPSTTIQPSVSLECTQLGTNFHFCSGNRIANNEKQVLLKKNESKIKCRLVCQIDAQDSYSLAEELCKSWNFSDYCWPPNPHLKGQNLTLVRPASETGLHGLQNSSTLKHLEYKPLRFDFSTTVSSNSSHERNNCIYFPLGAVTYHNSQREDVKCSNRLTSLCEMHCESCALNELWVESMSNTRIRDGDAFSMPLFWLLFFILIGISCSQAVVVIIGDAICFTLLEDEPGLFGRQRLWGSVGWGLSAFITGHLVDLANEGKTHKNYNLLIYTSLPLFALDLILAFNIKCVQTKVSTSIFKDISNLLKEPRLVVFVSWCIVTGVFTALVWNFLFLYIEDLADSYLSEKDLMIKTLQGLVIGVQSILGEVPFFFLSGSILKRIGHIHAMSLVLAAFSVRFLSISLVINPWYILLIETLNGVTYGLLTSTMNSYAAIVAPPGTESTMQGLVGAIFEGIGVSSGSYICGSLFDAYGGKMVFQIFSAAAAIAFVIHALLQPILRFRRLSMTCKDQIKGGQENDGLQLQ